MPSSSAPMMISRRWRLMSGVAAGASGSAWAVVMARPLATRAMRYQIIVIPRQPRQKTPTGKPSAPLTPVALAGCCAAFVLIGAMQALYGPAIPAFRSRFGVSPSVAGLGLSADFAGALIGIVLFHLLRSRLGDRKL